MTPEAWEWLRYGSAARDIISTMRDQYNALDAMTCRVFAARLPMWLGTRQRMETLSADLRRLADDIDMMCAAGEAVAKVKTEADTRLHQMWPNVFEEAVE